VKREQLNIIALQALLVLAGILLFALLPERSAIRLFVNSDALYMPSLFKDLFVHRTGIPVWHLNGAPNFFPEMLLYFTLMAVMKHTTLTIMAYGLVQMWLILFLMDRLFLVADVHVSHRTRYLLMLTYLLVPLSAVLNEGHLIPSQLLLGGYHAGFFINSLLAAILAFSYLKKGGVKKLIWLALLILLASISDKLFLMGFVAPFILFSLFHLFKKEKQAGYLLLIAVTGLTTLLALFAYRMINFLGAIEMITTGRKMFQFEQIPDAMSNFLHHMRAVIIDYPTQRILVLSTLLFLLGAPVYLILSLKKYVSGLLDTKKENSWAIVLFLFLFSIIILAAPIINGYYVGPSLIRYSYAGLVMGTAGLAYLASNLLSPLISRFWLRKYLSSFCSLVLLVLLLVTGIKNQALSGLKKYLDHYPESVRILDELKEEYGLKYGLGGYWQAKYSTMFSRNDLRLYSVANRTFRPGYHVTNENWYHDGGKGVYANPTFNFLETSAFKDTERLHELFGEDIDTLYNQNDMLVIRVPDFKIRREDREIYLLEP